MQGKGLAQLIRVWVQGLNVAVGEGDKRNSQDYLLQHVEEVIGAVQRTCSLVHVQCSAVILSMLEKCNSYDIESACKKCDA